MTSENKKKILDQKIGHVKMKQTFLLRKSERHDKSRENNQKLLYRGGLISCSPPVQDLHNLSQTAIPYRS